MKQIIKYIYSGFLLNLYLFGQDGHIRGQVVNELSEPLPGANIFIENTSSGTISDSLGNFSFDNLYPGSYIINVSYIGYKPFSRKYVIVEDSNEANTNYLDKLGLDEENDDDVFYALKHSNQILLLYPDAVALRQVNVTGHELEKSISDIMKQTIFGPSRIRESYMSVGASVDAVSIKDIKMSPSLNFYEGLDDVKEVETKQLSTIYTSLIVRGVGVTDARDYSQLVDGMQATNLNYGNNFGNITGLSEIDVANIELVHGAASVMYGPYSTSGLVLISSKTPWFYQGASYQLKTGFNYKADIQRTPFIHSAIRYAKAYDKFAWKFVFSNKTATEWVEPGDSTYLKSSPDADAVSAFDLRFVHGDDAPLNETTIGTLDSLENAIYGPIARTGYWDKDITETEVYNTKINGSLNYKITDDIDISYDIKGGWGSFTNVGIGKFWNNHSGGLNNGLTLNGPNWLLRGYTYREGQNPFNNSDQDIQWDIRAIAIEMQNWSKPDDIWLADYKAAFDGEVLGIDSGNHKLARDFADSEQSIDTNNTYRARLEPNTTEWHTVYDSLIRRDKQRSPTRLSDNGFYNVEFIYDLTDLVKYGGLQVGANFRQYEIGFHNGIMSNSPELNDEYGPINPWEYAVFIQGTKWLFNERLKIQGALRFDESETYGSNFSPSFSTVIKAMENNYFRFSYQKATLNPSHFWSFLNIPQQNLKMAIGGAKQNLERLGLEVLHDKAIVMDFVTGDTTHIKIPYPTGERLSAYEVGYKSLINDNFFFDINYYYNHKTNLRDDDNLVFLEEQILWTPTSDSTGYATPLDFPYYVYTHNEENQQTLHGMSLGLSYNFNNGLILSGNYNFISEVDTLIAYQPNRIEGSNVGTSRPKNRYKISLNHPRALKSNIGYSISARYTEKYWYDNYLWYGVGELGGNFNVDAQVSYILSEYNMLFKLGINNLLGQYYNTSVVTPKIGSTFYLSIDYDGLIK